MSRKSNLRLRLHYQIIFSSDKKVLRISHTLKLDKVVRYNFVPAIRYSFVPARKEEQFCTCTAPKLHRYSVDAREKERFCIGSKMILYSANAAKVLGPSTFDSLICRISVISPVNSI